MNPGDQELFGTRTPLIYCPVCSSMLEYAVDAEAADTDVVLDRSCPGCDYRDSVATTSLRAAIWYRRETRMLAELRPLAVFLVESTISDNALVARAAARDQLSRPRASAAARTPASAAPAMKLGELDASAPA